MSHRAEIQWIKNEVTLKDESKPLSPEDCVTAWKVSLMFYNCLEVTERKIVENYRHIFKGISVLSNYNKILKYLSSLSPIAVCSYSDYELAVCCQQHSECWNCMITEEAGYLLRNTCCLNVRDASPVLMVVVLGEESAGRGGAAWCERGVCEQLCHYCVWTLPRLAFCWGCLSPCTVAVPCVPTVWWRETWDTWCCPANQVGISMCALAAPWSCDEIQMVSRLCCRDEGESLYFWCNSTPQQRASMNRLPVLLCSVQYWVWDLADQGSQDTPEEFAPLASPGCAIFKCIVGSCFLAAALSGRAMQVSALERGVVPSASKWV